jgi:hypothetical protein
MSRANVSSRARRKMSSLIAADTSKRSLALSIA